MPKTILQDNGLIFQIIISKTTLLVAHVIKMCDIEI